MGAVRDLGVERDGCVIQCECLLVTGFYDQLQKYKSQV